MKRIKVTYHHINEENAPLWIQRLIIWINQDKTCEDDKVYFALIGVSTLLDSMSFKWRNTTIFGKDIKRELNYEEPLSLNIYDLNSNQIYLTVTYE